MRAREKLLRSGDGRARSVTGVLFAALALLLLPFAAAAQPKTELRIAYIPVMTWLPMLVAKDDGIFAKNDLEVSLTKFPNIANLPGTLGKQFDLVPTTAPDLLDAVASGLNVAAVAGETVETAANKSYQVLVRPDGSIKSPKDLAGKRVAGPGVGSVMHVALLYWVKLDGGDPSNISGVEVPFPNMMDQLKAGRVAAVEQLEPFVSQMLGKGFKSLGDPLLAVADPVLFPFWLADADWARAHRAVLKRFVVSLEGGLKVIKTDEPQARAILAKYSGLPEKVIARIPIPDYDFSITPAELEVWRKVMISEGHPLTNVDVNKIVVTAE